MSEFKQKRKYKGWWENKKVRLAGYESRPFKLAVNVEYIGNSMHGCVLLHYDDGTNEFVQDHGAFAPRKKDVEVEPE